MRWRTVGRVAATVLVGLVLPVAVGAVGIAGARKGIYTVRDAARRPPGSRRPRCRPMRRASRRR